VAHKWDSKFGLAIDALQENGMDPISGIATRSPVGATGSSLPVRTQSCIHWQTSCQCHPPRFARRMTRQLLLGAFLLISPGCVFDKFFPPAHGIQPLEANVSPQGLIEHVNRNITNLHSWSCTDATVSATSKYMPIKLPLSTTIAVERDKNFRLRARSPLGDEADFGSNSERFWFWMRRNNPPWVFTARHADMNAVGQRLQIPFHPDWIMEALGVVPLNPNNITHQQPGKEANLRW
jgi:hypothetical protein